MALGENWRSGNGIASTYSVIDFRFCWRGVIKVWLRMQNRHISTIAQQALLKILDSLETFRCQSRFTTWATSIAVRIGISQLRRHYYRDISLDATSESDENRIHVTDSSSRVSDDSEGRHQIFSLLQQLIDDTLSDKQRLAIRGTLQGLPIEEIARRLNSNRNAVYKLVHDARLRIREGFESNGVTAEEIRATIS